MATTITNYQPETVAMAEVKIRVAYNHDGTYKAYRIKKNCYGTFICKRFLGLTCVCGVDEWEKIGSSKDYREAVYRIWEDAWQYGQIKNFEIEDCGEGS